MMKATAKDPIPRAKFSQFRLVNDDKRFNPNINKIKIETNPKNNPRLRFTILFKALQYQNT